MDEANFLDLPRPLPEYPNLLYNSFAEIFPVPPHLI